MAIPQGVTDTFGAIGGGLLAACLLPQLWKVWRLKSAQDLSLWFLVAYGVATLSCILYLYFEDAMVGWICCTLELACITLTALLKVYFDHFGPNSRRAVKRARPEARLTSSPSFAAEVGLSVHDVGTTFARLLAPAPNHAAHHLLLDARLHLAPEGAISQGNRSPPVPVSEAGSESGPKDASCRSSGSGVCRADGGSSGSTHEASIHGGNSILEAVGGMVEEALAGEGLPVLRRRSQAFPSFRRRGGAAEETMGGTAAAAEAADADVEMEAALHGPDMLFVTCRGGYATAVWHAASSTLSLNMFAASDAAVGAMAGAAQALCGQLVERWPGSSIEASSVARLWKE